MKLFYIPLLYLVFNITLTRADKKTFAASMENCRKEFPITKDEMKQFVEDKNVQFSENFKCHIKCILEKENILKKGMLIVDAFLKYSLELQSLKNHEAEVRKAIEECKNDKGTDDCETSFMLAKCLHGYHTLRVQ
ncbi:general odorant-binding protein 56h-like [Musca vetustissima]|uniref:general odorant-binding protein 56h-like n=1 Tax=Musca vetustissima TaxID=27455 RepID=UPI002AB78C72|nr:general odorant-binding protein 56h-like [Musca vetustissima]